MRLFAGIRVPENDALRSALNELQRHAELKCVEPGNLHINLKFLGEVDEQRTAEITAVLDGLQGFGRFEVALRGIGAFPSSSFIRVLWAGAESERLVSLAKLADAELAGLGFKREADYKAHVTLARVRERPGEWIKSVLSDNAGRDFGKLSASEVLLIRSVLTGKGPQYEDIHRVKL